MSWPLKEGIYLDENYNLYYPPGASHTDGIPEELMREIIDPHWSQFPPQNPLYSHGLGIIYALLFLISLPGHITVVYVFLKNKEVRAPQNLYFFSLACSDLGFMFFECLPVIVNIFVQRYWMYGVLGCRLYACAGAIFGTTSMLIVAVIAYDRYRVVTKGCTAKRLTFSQAFLNVLLCWVYSIAVSVPPFFGWGAYKAEGLLNTCSYDYIARDFNRMSFMVHAFLFNYFIPLIFVIFFYYKVIVSAHLQATSLAGQEQGGQEDEKHIDETKVIKASMTSALIWFFAWTPYAITTMVPFLGDMSIVTPLATQLPACFAKLSSILNPMVYAFSHPAYRRAIAAECPCFGLVVDVREKEKTIGGTIMTNLN
ncbi:compound eye opsin BCRH2 [Eurytemora carolleeae]|uniref:compound eye opsin BCRH2 n=1 Tax=Eurytemora carolleeae TaxID=1294199 RepID=UPI000C756C3C|nr:compound eye opsin BCRH2 [Eurytemora carolleeae]|eukprot:XP_023329413.1 compound eye opsin BCRH2-like [Eurytemora affinis]